MATLQLRARSAAQDSLYLQEIPLEVGDRATIDLSHLQPFGLIGLQFSVQFPSGHYVQAEASVRLVQDLKIAHTTAKRVEVQIDHETEINRAVVAYASPGYGMQRDCALHCPATGKRSNGPCIDCSDEEYTIYLCC